MTTTHKREPKEWTVAIYMVADGPSGNRGLDEIASGELARIIRAADPDSGPKPLDKIHVAVQVDLSDQDGILRLAVDGTYDDLTISRIPEADATAADTLKGFFKWVATDFPALRYCVVFWGHSSGPIGLFGDRASPNGPVNRLTLPKLRGVMHQFASALNATGRASSRQKRAVTDARYGRHRSRQR